MGLIALFDSDRSTTARSRATTGGAGVHTAGDAALRADTEARVGASAAACGGAASGRHTALAITGQHEHSARCQASAQPIPFEGS
jgi:hypothetical protein